MTRLSTHGRSEPNEAGGITRLSGRKKDNKGGATGSGATRNGHAGKKSMV